MAPTRAAAVVLLLLLTGCSSSSDTPSTGSTTPAGTASTAPADDTPTITVKQFRYTPLQVAPGTTITVKNLDDAPHTVTSDDGTFDSGQVEGDPKTFAAPAAAGTYSYHCAVHPSMKGQLTVG